jgi:hypothetical protein
MLLPASGPPGYVAVRPYPDRGARPDALHLRAGECTWLTEPCGADPRKSLCIHFNLAVW